MHSTCLTGFLLLIVLASVFHYTLCHRLDQQKGHSLSSGSLDTSLGRRVKRQAGSACGQPIQAALTFNTFHPTQMGLVYANGLHCRWTINAPAGKRVLLRFSKFSVEGIAGCSFDSVQIDDGPLLCGIGPNCSGNFPSKEFMSSNESMVVKFTSDVSVAHSGFNADYRVVDATYQPQNFNTTDHEGSCVQGFNANENVNPVPGTVGNARPNCPANITATDEVRSVAFNYTNNNNCRWNLRCSNPAKKAAVRFTRFSTEGIESCPYDYLTISRSPGPVIQRLCGQGVNCSGNYPGQVYTGRNLAFHFVSDGSVHLGGFVMEYFCVESTYFGGSFKTIENTTARCNEITVDGGGDVFNPNVMHNFHRNCSGNLTAIDEPSELRLTTNFHYHNYARCQINITGPAGKIIKLTPRTFDVEGSEDCNMDKLIVYDSVGSLSPPLCGRCPGCIGNFPNVEIVSHGPRMTLEFISDSSISGAGFRMMYEIEDEGYIPRDISREVTGNPNVTLNDDTSEESDSSAETCMYSLTATRNSQVLQSLASSATNRNYSDDANCHWSIRAQSGVIRLALQRFDVEGSEGCIYDSFTVSDEMGPLSAPLCGQGPGCLGNWPTTEIVSRGPQLNIDFVSDGSVNGAGFRGLYQIVDQGYVARDISGEITGSLHTRCNDTTQEVDSSTDNDNHNCSKQLTATDSTQYLFSHDEYRNQRYSANMLCISTIVCPAGKKVMVRFIYFDLEGAATCSYDSVTLSSGNLAGTRLCGNGLQCPGNFPQMEYVSVDNTASVTLRTDGSVHFSGFEAEYKCVDPAYLAKPHIADENTTFTNIECNVCPRSRLSLSPGAMFGMPRGGGEDSYANNLHCQWKLNTNTSALGNLTLQFYDIEESANCVNDALSIWGPNFEEIRLCGRSDRPTSYVFSESLNVDFISNSEGTRTGFDAVYQPVQRIEPRRKRSLPRLFRKRSGLPLI